MICTVAIAFDWLPLNDHYAFTQEKSVSSVSTEMTGPMDFKTFVRLALERSPHFVGNALEIDVRRLDESDSRWAFIPSLSMYASRLVGLKKEVTENGVTKEEY